MPEEVLRDPNLAGLNGYAKSKYVAEGVSNAEFVIGTVRLMVMFVLS